MLVQGCVVLGYVLVLFMIVLYDVFDVECFINEIMVYLEWGVLYVLFYKGVVVKF